MISLLKRKNFDLSFFIKNINYIKNIRGRNELILNILQMLTTTYYEVYYDFL